MHRLIITIFLLFSCDQILDSKTETPFYLLSIDSVLYNSTDLYEPNNADIYSGASFDIHFFNQVDSYEISIDGLNVKEKKGFILGGYWYYDEEYDTPEGNTPTHQWYGGNGYESIVSATMKDSINIQSKATCKMPGSFRFNQSSIPSSLESGESFVLNWSNVNYEDFFLIDIDVYDTDWEVLLDTIIFINKDVNEFEFGSEYANIDQAEYIYISNCNESI